MNCQDVEIQRQVLNYYPLEYSEIKINQQPPNIQAPQFWETPNNQINSPSQNIGIFDKMRIYFQEGMQHRTPNSEINLQPQRNYGKRNTKT